MEATRFDAVSRAMVTSGSRRGLLVGLGAALMGMRGASAQDECPLVGQTRNRKGQCRCPAGTDPCPDGCVDRNRDAANCGTCGTVCPDDATCVKGACRCSTGSQLCDGVCYDIQNDRYNCGGCERECGSGTICVRGTCQPGGPCYDAGCGTCSTCNGTTDGVVCIGGGRGASIDCTPEFACTSVDDCLALGPQYNTCFTTDAFFRQECVPVGGGRCGFVYDYCVP